MFSIAVIIAVYKNDKYEDFVSAIKSITFNQKSIQQDRIKVYLHIDGHVSKNMMEFIESSGFIYKSIHSKNPVGLAKGLNKLISILEDEKYVFRMDADDLSLPNRLQYQIEYMENNPIIDISGGSIQEFIASSNNIVATRCYPLTHEEIFKVIYKASPFAHVTICFRRTSLAKIGFYPVDYPLNEDIALWFQALKNGATCGNIEQVLVKVRMDGAYDRRSSVKAFNEFKVYWNIMLWKKSFSFFPFMRFVFRFLPIKLVKIIYNSFVRKLVTK
ncbi:MULTISPECIES: glycosyltransferase [Enterobacterales]|uniref:glycosyltransferase n=2 Tax=Gammaproteobacteria TaxID=1236 RepID=UPI00098C0858|nr:MULTISPECIES: glycosyltransferase [Enterobacterales]WOO49894.1 glycosyltransferase [Hafnia alvei]ELB1101890.1 glycosyltransferase [Proteus mirabilis]ELB1103782.1 glycosyltransferase [Proteus mirabilis]MCT0087485.1 glycosyltransferase [Proteus mirabilis]QKG47378.1 glycosyltransferase [Proteus mirabilis]